VLPDAFQTLRVPLEASWADMTARPGYLRLTGRESLTSRHRQSLVGRRRQAFHCEAEVVLEAAPRSFQHMAGLVAYYDTRNHVYLHVTHDERLGRVVALAQSDAGEMRRPVHEPVAVPGAGPVRLRMTLDDDRLRCWVGGADGTWRALGPMFDAGLLSDEYDGLGFTGTFLAMAAQDLVGNGFAADFASFVYRETDPLEAAEAQPPATTSSSA
jgi:xylan 1,4-beta-xylosidase